MNDERPGWFSRMLDGNFYPQKPEKVELIETHISWVFLAGELVYKIKKPVDFGFLNYTTLELRRHYCQEELRLNRRLCPEIYRAVVPICRKGTDFILDAGCQDGAEAVEWAVEMERMPDDGRMDRMIEADLVDQEEIRALGEILVPFYKSAVCSEEKSRELGGIDTVRENCTENFQQTEEFIGTLIEKETYDKIRDYTLGFLESQSHLFKQRQEQKRIVEGHGDLYSANICIDRKKDKIYVFDCIEFNERFRYGDQACDMAFLLMDLDFLGLADLSALMFEIYCSGLSEESVDELMRFYKCYRAYVRGKIACFTWASVGQGDQEFKEAQKALAASYFKLALNYAGGLPSPVLYVFMGLTGTGKSTLAQAFSEGYGLEYFNSDVVRKELIAGLKATDSRLEPFGKGIYSPEFTARTYRALARLAGRRLAAGRSVVLDATFTSRQAREKVIRLASAIGARLVFIHCTCTEEVVRRRFEKRFSEDRRVSDGRMEIYLKQKQAFSPLEQAEGTTLIEIDTAPPLKEVLARLEEALASARLAPKRAHE